MKEEWIWFSYKRPKRLHIHDLIYSIVLLSILSKSSFCDLNCLATTIFYRHTFSFILNESPFSLFLHLLSILRGCRHSKICNNFERITRLKSLSVHISYQKYIFWLHELTFYSADIEKITYLLLKVCHVEQNFFAVKNGYHYCLYLRSIFR